eukprot:103853-Pyramimonas_sp.AAC.1
MAQLLSSTESAAAPWPWVGGCGVAALVALGSTHWSPRRRRTRRAGRRAASRGANRICASMSCICSSWSRKRSPRSAAAAVRLGALLEWRHACQGHTSCCCGAGPSGGLPPRFAPALDPASGEPVPACATRARGGISREPWRRARGLPRCELRWHGQPPRLEAARSSSTCPIGILRRWPATWHRLAAALQLG